LRLPLTTTVPDEETAASKGAMVAQAMKAPNPKMSKSQPHRIGRASFRSTWTVVPKGDSFNSVLMSITELEVERRHATRRIGLWRSFARR